MKIGKYLIVSQEQVDRNIECLKEENKVRDDKIRYYERIMSNNEELIQILEEQLKEYKSELDVYSLFIDCILNKETRKAIAIYNRTKSIRIKQKCLNSIPIKKG
ncbi:hypothetical protein KWY15_18205 [Clostridioides difficile]|uniref:Uncharacterized protein n=4 Tax=root TaxID=1 RepID=A0A1J1J902_9CAUD|nr:hypothetical protein [Clostridioides difficile]YP_004508423.1 hypothetical protein phiCD38-2_gp45 [Clostridium phage phiCD38-2]ALY06986.1 hypothetical protein CDHS1_43 [Clostridium phage CDSH1]WFG79353.1 hypothetical protein JPGLOODI_00036 [Clostridioides phage AR1075-1]CUL03834.1 hypothetical protein [Clostridium phage slur17]AEF56920.1 hypothetical protein phiCD38-2_gp45 [Clostridium phage phiCD38-2]EGT4211833.1 hypothetical protein [Clostridioides difficile]